MVASFFGGRSLYSLVTVEWRFLQQLLSRIGYYEAPLRQKRRFYLHLPFYFVYFACLSNIGPLALFFNQRSSFGAQQRPLNVTNVAERVGDALEHHFWPKILKSLSHNPILFFHFCFRSAEIWAIPEEETNSQADKLKAKNKKVMERSQR